MKFRILFIALSVLVFTSCVTIPGPDSKNQALTIGRIIQTGKNYPSFKGATVNGTHKVNIILTLRNVKTDKITEITTRAQGFFITTKLPPGKYEMKSLYLKVKKQNSWAAIRINTYNNRYFEVEGNSVNNLGLIEWLCDKKYGESYWMNKKYDDCYNFFLDKYKDSKWSTMTWKSVRTEK